MEQVRETLAGLNGFFKTTAFRLSAIYVALFSAFVLVAVAYIYWHTNVLLTRQLDQTIRAELQGLAEQYRSGGLARLSAVITARSQTPGNSLYYVTDASGYRVAGNLRSVSKKLLSAKGRLDFTYTRPLGSHDEIRAAHASVIALEDGFKLIVGRDIEDRRAFERRVRTALLWALALIVSGGFFGAWVVSRKILQRIDVVTAASKSIMAGDLSQRIPVTGVGDELDRLSENLNTMLERIEGLMRGLREVSHNIAHDLRTPLNRLRNRVEAALLDRSDPGVCGTTPHRAALEKTIEEADGLIKTFNALLSIARLEAGADDSDMAQVDLAEIIQEVAELYEPVAEQQGQVLHLAGLSSLMVKGDRQLLGQAVANLIDNALKYAPALDQMPGAENKIHIQVRHELCASNENPVQKCAQIIVADHGPGIPPAERARALKRFVRLEASRSQPGSGLGLSLVNAVASRHKGQFLLQDNKPGLKAVVQFPC